MQKIIQLHRHGGGYFYEGRERAVDPDDTRDFDPPYRMLNAESLRYGDSIRLLDEAEELEGKLGVYAEMLGTMPIDKWAINEQVILDAAALANVEAETLDGRLCTSSPRFLSGYLDRFYLKMLETFVSPSESSSCKPS